MTTDSLSGEPLCVVISTWLNNPFYGWTVAFSDRRQPLCELLIVGCHTHSQLCSAAVQALVDTVAEGQVVVSFLAKDLRNPSLYELPERFTVSPEAPFPELLEIGETAFRNAKADAHRKIRSVESIVLPNSRLTVVAADASVSLPDPATGNKYFMGVGWVVAIKGSHDDQLHVHKGSSCFAEDKGTIKRAELLAIKCAIEETHKIYPQLAAAVRNGALGKPAITRKFLICTDSTQALHALQSPAGSKDESDMPVVESIRGLRGVMDSDIVWVAGHSHNVYNRLADALAKAARKKAELHALAEDPSIIEKTLSPLNREVEKLTVEAEEFLRSEEAVRQNATKQYATSMSALDDAGIDGTETTSELPDHGLVPLRRALSGIPAVPPVHALSILLTTFIAPPYCTWTLVFDDGREPLIQTTQNPSATHVTLLLDAVQILAPLMSGHRGEAVLHVLREEHREQLTKAPELLPAGVGLHAGVSWVR